MTWISNKLNQQVDGYTHSYIQLWNIDPNKKKFNQAESDEKQKNQIITNFYNLRDITRVNFINI